MKRLLTLPFWPLYLVLLALVVALVAHYGYYGYYGFDESPDFYSPWYGQLWFEHIFSVLLGCLFGAFFSDKFKQYRRWIIIGLVVLAIALFTISSTAGGNITFFIGSMAAMYWILKNDAPEKKISAHRLTTFGSAEWATLEHLQQHGLVGESKNGFLLGSFTAKEQQHPLHYNGDRHLLTVAPTRSGKGVASIIPNALTYEGSMLLIDPKGENAIITAARRGAGDAARNIPGMGQTVHVVDPWGITGLPTARFNPLDWLDPADDDISENAMMLADSIVTPQSADSFWDEEAKALLMGLLLYVAIDDREKDQRTLGRVRDIIRMGNTEFEDVLMQMQDSGNPLVVSTAQRTITKEAKLQSNVRASLQAHTHFLDSPRLRSNLAHSDFRFEDLKSSKMTVYLVLPADRLNTFGRWLRLLVQQALTVNARNIAIKPEKPILFLLDEMATLGRLTMVEQAYGLMAGFGMQLWGIIQDLSQLEKIYGKGWETFIGNSGVLQYFGSRDLKTAQYFSSLCGVTTIAKFSLARSVAESFSRTFGGKESSTSYGTTHTRGATFDVAQRHLAFPDELMVLKGGRQLILVENYNPIPANQILWYRDQSLKSLGVSLK